jgi:hypothetical protein
MTAGKRVYLVAALVVVALMGGLVVGWGYNGWDLAKTALLGDTVAPIVGVLSLVAVAAGLWSVRIQHQALELQRAASAQQQDSLNAQLELQRRELAHQREALEAELRYRRHTVLREVYVPFLTASSAYLDALHRYHRDSSRTDGRIEHRVRLEWMRPCEEAYAELKRAYTQALLVDTNQERHQHRWPLSREERLEPWIDTEENQKDWCTVVLYRIGERTHHHCALRDSLHREFGAEFVEEDDMEAREFEENMRADLKAQADAITERIGAQLKEAARAEAIRNGRLPPR